MQVMCSRAGTSCQHRLKTVTAGASLPCSIARSMARGCDRHLPADSGRRTWTQTHGSAAPSVTARPISASPTAASTAKPFRVLAARLLARLRLLNMSAAAPAAAPPAAVLPLAAAAAAAAAAADDGLLWATCSAIPASNSNAKSSVSGWNNACSGWQMRVSEQQPMWAEQTLLLSANVLFMRQATNPSCLALCRLACWPGRPGHRLQQQELIFFTASSWTLLPHPPTPLP